MVIGCPKCDTRYRLDDSKIPAGGRPLRCGRCSHVFPVTSPAPPPAEEQASMETIGCSRFTPAAAGDGPERPSGPAAGAPGAAGARGAAPPGDDAGDGLTFQSPAADTIPLGATAGGLAAAGAAAAPRPVAAPPPPEATPRIALAPQPTTPPPASSPAAPANGNGAGVIWILRGESGEEMQLDRNALRELIRQDEISEDTMLRPANGGEELPAGQVPQLQRYFRLKQAAPAAAAAPADAGPLSPAAAARAGRCTIHPARDVEHVCTVCHTLFCALCVGEKEFGTARVKWCLKCDDRCIPYEGIRNVVPFWREIPRLVAYPLEGWGPFMVLCCAVLSFFGSVMPGPGKVLYFFVLAYQLHILSESAGGKRKLPDWPDMSNVWEISARGLKAVVVSLIAWLPVLAFNFAFFSNMISSFSEEMMDPMAVEASTEPGADSDGMMPPGVDGEIDVDQFVDENGEFDFEAFQAAMQAQDGVDGAGGERLAADLKGLARAGAVLLLGNLFLILLVCLYYPMCLMIAAIFNTVLPALNPFLIARCIGRIKADYAMALVFCGILAIGGGIAQVLLSIVPLAGPLLGSFVGMYFVFIQMHVLGWTAHQGWDRLNWDIQT